MKIGVDAREIQVDRCQILSIILRKTKGSMSSFFILKRGYLLIGIAIYIVPFLQKYVFHFGTNGNFQKH